MSVAAIIDIGSNSIKLLVATRSPNGTLTILHTAISETRISTGISKQNPSLSAPSISAATAAIQSLLAQSSKFSPTITAIVATSAVRDASNRAQFIQHLQEKTGHTLRTLSGDEEATLIALGISTDPALRNTGTFTACDLGGGSLEILHFDNGTTTARHSYQLGCVRLTEQFIKAPSLPIPPSELAAIAHHIQSTLATTPALIATITHTPLIITGGTALTAQSLLKNTTGTLTRSDLQQLLASLAPLPISARLKLHPTLPPQRADIFPAALQTLITLSTLIGTSTLQLSQRNLRYGLALHLLQ